jgi:hypothetical protein
MDSFASYHAGIEDALRAIEERQVQHRDQVRSAVKLRHGEWRRIAETAALGDLAKRLIDDLDAAERDSEVSPEQVRALEALIYERLPDSTDPASRRDIT